MDKPAVSVVMPTYNYGYLISDSIRSVLSQTFDQLELIIIDNHSSDNTEEVVRRFSDQRIQYIKFANHGIIAASRNKGINLAQGQYVAFIDSDDKWYPNKLERAIVFFRKFPNFDAVCHDEDWRYENGRVEKTKNGPYRKYKDLLYKRNSLSTSAVVVKKDVFCKVGIFSENPGYAGVEDYELWLRISRAGRIGFLHEALGECFIHQNSFSAKVEQSYLHLLNVVRQHHNSLEKEYVSDKLKMRFRESEILRQCGRDLLKRKDISIARKYLWQALALNPISAKLWFNIGKSFLLNERKPSQ